MNRLKLLGLLIIGVAVVGVGLATWATPASANAGPHGGYTLTTSACAGCHRAHTAESANLVKADSIYGLCTSCHSGLVSTDVVHGVLQGATNTDGVTPRKLNGGGFVQQDGANVTSRHKVEDVPINGTPFVGDTVAFGSQNGDGVPAGDVGAGVQGVLECTSCHNPHGSTNYRILIDGAGGHGGDPKWVADDPDLLDWVQYQVLATRDDAPNYGFDFTNPADCPAFNTPGAGTPTSTPWSGVDGTGTRCIQRFTSGVLLATPAAAQNASGQYLGMNGFCATCHKSYFTESGSAHRANSLNTPVSTVGPGTPTRLPSYPYPGVQYSTEDGVSIPRYRHAVVKNRSLTSYPKQPLRFAALGIDPNPPASSVYGADKPGGTVQLQYRAFGCLSCHYAHGSGAAATPAAGTTPEGPAGDSALLFWGNRGVCVSCHQSVSPMATLTPTATP